MLRKTLIYIFSLHLLTLLSPYSIAREQFLLLDSLGLVGKPDTEQLGFIEVRPISTGSLWPKDGDLSEPDFSTIEAAIKKYPNTLGIICLDIEHWSTSTQDDRELKESRSEEHTSELQSRGHLVCRLLLEKKKTRLRKND